MDDVRVGEQVRINVFFDGGSTCSLILTSVAERYGLQGHEVRVTIATVNGEKDRTTKLYMVELINMSGERKLVRALGMESISGRIPFIRLDGVKHHFSSEVQDVWEAVSNRPIGEIEMLVGSEVAGLHPKAHEVDEDLVVMKSQFGTGWTIYGSHSQIENLHHMEFTEEVSAIRQGGFKVLECGKISFVPTVTLTQDREVGYRDSHKIAQEKVRNNATIPKEFFLGEDMGVEAPRRCKKCKGCPDCSWRGMVQSEKEAEEYRMIEDGIKYNQDTGKFSVEYPFLDNPNKLGNNLGQAIKIAERLEKKLEKEGLTEQAEDVFQKMVDYGALRKLSQIEMDSWVGPVHYISIQHVLNPGSETTPLRLVTNTSLVDPRSGLSLNGLLAKGPNCLADTYELLIRFRGYSKGLISDITKAYYALVTGLMEMHLRRVVWRKDRTGNWDIYGFLCVSFGDRPAAVILDVVIKLTVQMFGGLDLLAAKRLKEDMFVDDLVSGGTDDEISRYVGEEDPDTLQCSGTMPTILAQGRFTLKAIAWTGEHDGPKLIKLGAAVLGLGFSTQYDTLTVKLGANISPRKRGVPTGKDLTVDTLEQLVDCKLTRRLVLSIANSIYDVVGFCSPLTIRMKVAMKKLFDQEYGLGWDTILPSELEREWKELITMLVVADKVEIYRCTRPAINTGAWDIVAYFDGSDLAFSCVIYAVWELEGDQKDVRLLASKARVAPDWSKNTPRLELCGAVLVTRVVLRVVRALAEKPRKVYIVGDAETVLASREKSSGYFSEYFSNRIGETWDNQKRIQEYCQVGDENGEWYHVPSDSNPADRPSRVDSEPPDIMPGSSWQRGPNYLRLPRKDWALERNFADRKGKVQVPVEEVARKYRDKLSVDCKMVSFDILDQVDKEIEADRTVMVSNLGAEGTLGPEDEGNPIVDLFDKGYCTNSWDTLLRRTGYLFRWIVQVINKRGEGLVTERQLAERFWIRVAMTNTREAWKKKKLTKLTLWEHEGLLVITGRAEAGLKKYFGVHYLPVIMARTRVGQLIMLWAHEQDHSNRDTTLMTATQVAWVVGGRELAGKIKGACIRCRFLDRKLAGQKMAVLPGELTVPCPPFTHLGLDLAGPIEIRIVGGNKTTRGNKGTFKAWIVVIVCLNTKAVKLYMACGYATKDFLLAWEQHTSDCGNPLTVHSDRGSQLVAASKEVEDRPDLDWDEIANMNEGKISWNFCPSGAQFRNGATEIYVKKVKRSLLHTYGGKGLNQQEFNTALKRVASILNSRPIYALLGPKGGADPDYLLAITPNMLVTGRTNTDIPNRVYEDVSDALVRLEYIADLERLWWGQHKVQDFTSLVPTQKWTESRRNMAVGDVIMIQYSSKSKSGEYRLGRVVSVELDDDNLVRTCVVKYSLVQHLPKADRLKYKGVTVKYIRVAVQRLCLIVPVEEQANWTKVSEEDSKAGQDIIDNNQEEGEVRQNSSKIGVIVDKTVYRQHILKQMLKAKGEYDVIVAKLDARSWNTIEVGVEVIEELTEEENQRLTKIESQKLDGNNIKKMTGLEKLMKIASEELAQDKKSWRHDKSR